MSAEADTPREDAGVLTPKQLAVLQGSILVVALCGIAYELIIATVSSYLLGNSVYQFSITIGLFMFAMGLGSYLTKWLTHDLVTSFIAIEIAVAIAGGLSSTILFVVFPYRAFYVPVMYGLIIVIGALVGLEIPILTRVLARGQTLRSSIAHVLSLDYLGALVGSVAFPLVLLPHLGLFRSSFAVALLNIGVALFNVAVFASLLRRPRRLALVTIGAGALLIAGMLAGTALTVFAESRLFVDRIIHREQTPYQRIILTRDEVNNEHRLYLDGHLQFAERDEYRYHEALVHPALSLPTPRDRVLVLGGGDGLAAREILGYPDVALIDIVDIDPAITELCSTLAPIRALNRGALDDPRVTVHNVDAFLFLRESPDLYDRVIIDLPDPHNEALNNLYSVEFYRLLRARLADHGAFATQSSSPYFTREVFWSIAATIRAAGMDTYSYQVMVPAFGAWGFTLAAAEGPAPTSFDIEAETRFLTDEVMARAGVFGKDDGPVEGEINSIFAPRLYALYRRGIDR